MRGAGVPAALLVLAGGCLAAGLAAAAGLREAPPGPEEPSGQVVHPLRDGRIWRVSAGSGLIVFAQLSILGFLVVFLHDERGLSTAAAAGVLAAIQAAGAALRVVAGAWSDRTGERVRPLVRMAVSLTLALVLAAALADAYLAVTVLAFVAAGSLSLSWNGLSFTAVAELAGRGRAGAALGIQQTSLTLAGAATPPVFAALVGATSWRIGFAAAALAPVAGAAVLRLVDREA